MSHSFSKDFFLKKFQTISIESGIQTSQSDPSFCTFLELLQNYPEIFSKSSLDPESFKKFFLNPDDAIANSPTYPPKFQNKKGFSSENLKKPLTFSAKKDYFSCLSSPFEKIVRSALKRKDVNLSEKIWFSEDSSGVNGPFSTQEMDFLFKEEKLARNLKVAFGRKEKFSYINKLYERFCGEIPLKEIAKEEKDEKMINANKPTRFDVLLDYDKKTSLKEEKKNNSNENFARNENKIERAPKTQENNENVQNLEAKIQDNIENNIDNNGINENKLATEIIQENKEIIVKNETEITKNQDESCEKSEKTNDDNSINPIKKEIIVENKQEKQEVLQERDEKVQQETKDDKDEDNNSKTISKKKKNKKKKGNMIDITELIPEVKPVENKPVPLQEAPVKELEKPTNYQVKEEDFPSLPMNPAPKVQKISDDKDFIKVKKPSKNDKNKKSQQQQEITEVPVVKTAASMQKKVSEPQMSETLLEKTAIKEKEEVKAIDKPKTQEKQINEMDFPSLEESKNSKVISQKNKPIVIQEPKKKKNLNGEWDFDDEPGKKTGKKEAKKEPLLINDENFPSLM